MSRHGLFTTRVLPDTLVACLVHLAVVESGWRFLKHWHLESLFPAFFP